MWFDGIWFNPICTDEEYAEQGFSPAEIPLIRRHDMLFNQKQKWGYLKPRKEAEMYAIVDRLGL